MAYNSHGASRYTHAILVNTGAYNGAGNSADEAVSAVRREIFTLPLSGQVKKFRGTIIAILVFGKQKYLPLIHGPRFPDSSREFIFKVGKINFSSSRVLFSRNSRGVPVGSFALSPSIRLLLFDVDSK